MSTSHAEIIPFQPRARLLRLIGGELVSDEIVAVMELVKNAYDADATRVNITFTNVMSRVRARSSSRTTVTAWTWRPCSAAGCSPEAVPSKG
jgi:hypothetical protein